MASELYYLSCCHCFFCSVPIGISLFDVFPLVSSDCVQFSCHQSWSHSTLCSLFPSSAASLFQQHFPHPFTSFWSPVLHLFCTIYCCRWLRTLISAAKLSSVMLFSPQLPNARSAPSYMFLERMPLKVIRYSPIGLTPEASYCPSRHKPIKWSCHVSASVWMHFHLV